MKRVRAAFAAAEDDSWTGSGDVSAWLAAGRRRNRLGCRAAIADRQARLHVVDVALCEHPLTYDAALITLRSWAPDWIRDVLTGSLAVAECCRRSKVDQPVRVVPTQD